MFRHWELKNRKEKRQNHGRTKSQYIYIYIYDVLIHIDMFF